MNKLRISYSLLSTWKRGNYEDCIRLYKHDYTKKTPQMTYGNQFDKKIKDTIMNEKTVKIGDRQLKFNSPEVDYEVKVDYNEIAILHGFIDCRDKNIIYEFKTGKTDSLSYLSDYQVDMYILMCELLEKPIEKAYLIRYDQYTNMWDISQKWKTNHSLNRARNFIDSLSPEIYTFFQKEGIL